MIRCPAIRDFKEAEYSENVVIHLETKALKLFKSGGVRSLSEIF